MLVSTIHHLYCSMDHCSDLHISSYQGCGFWTQHHELEQLSTVFKIGKKAHLKLWYMMIMSKLSTKKYQRAKVLEICITLHKNLELVQLTGERNPRQDSETQMEI